MAGIFVVPESLFLTITFAILSGVFLTFATAATHYPTHLDRLAKEDAERDMTATTEEATQANFDIEEQDSFSDDDADSCQDEQQDSERTPRKKVSKCTWRWAYGMNLLLAAIGGTINLVGTWFGPVSLFVPIKQVSQIISGMTLFSYVLKTDPRPSKDTSVGNYIIMISAIMLIFVGPKIREEPIDIEALFSKEKNQICAGIIVLAFGVVFPFQFLLAFTSMPTTDRVNFVFLLMTEVISAVLGNSTSKLFPLLPPTGKYFIINLVLLVTAFLTIAFSSILRSTAIHKQTEYLPLMLSANIILNGIVGLIMWEDNIINIGAYSCLYLFFVLGVYLVSDYGTEILPGKPIGDQTSVADGLMHGRARIIMSERSNRIIEVPNVSSPADEARKSFRTMDETVESTINALTLASIYESDGAPETPIPGSSEYSA